MTAVYNSVTVAPVATVAVGMTVVEAADAAAEAAAAMWPAAPVPIASF